MTSRFARGVLVSELTVATVVVMGAAFIGLGIYRYLHQPLGFEYQDRSDVQVRADGRRPSGQELAAAVSAIRGLPGVRAAGLEAQVLDRRTIEVPGQSLEGRALSLLAAPPGHFEAKGLTLLRGRWFAAPDFAGVAGGTAVVDARFAASAWPGADAVGETVHALGVPRTVIGVVEPRRFALDREPPPTVYVPVEDGEARVPIVVWAPGIDEDVLNTAVTRAVASAAPSVQVSITPETFERLFSRGAGEAWFQAPVVGAFGALALVLAGVGLFGVVAYLVEQRRREFGIRMALGARPSDVWRAVVKESVRPAVLGLLFGACGAWALESVVRASVFGWPSSGRLAVGVVALGLFAVAILAALVPAARAMRIDPAVTLRAE